MCRIILLRSGPHNHLFEGRSPANGKLKSVFLPFNFFFHLLGISLEWNLWLDRFDSLERGLMRDTSNKCMIQRHWLLVSDYIHLIVVILEHLEVASLFLLRACVLRYIFLGNILKMWRWCKLWYFKAPADYVRWLFAVWKVDVLLILRLSHNDYIKVRMTLNYSYLSEEGRYRNHAY